MLDWRHTQERDFEVAAAAGSEAGIAVLAVEIAWVHLAFVAAAEIGQVHVEAEVEAADIQH